MSREVHVQFCEGLRGKFPLSTRLVILGQDKAELHLIKGSIGKFLNEKLKLELKLEISFIAPLSEGIPFLGFRIFPALIRLQHNTLVRFSRKYRQKERQYLKGEIEEQDFIRSTRASIFWGLI